MSIWKSAFDARSFSCTPAHDPVQYLYVTAVAPSYSSLAEAPPKPLAEQRLEARTPPLFEVSMHDS